MRMAGMRKSKLTEERIIGYLKRAEAGLAVAMLYTSLVFTVVVDCVVVLMTGCPFESDPYVLLDMQNL
jgi:hypothetical protein